MNREPGLGGQGATRRSFFGVLMAAVSAAVGLVMSVPVARFLVFPLFGSRRASDWIEVGDASGFVSPGPMRAEILVRRVDGWVASTAKRAVWVVRREGGQLGVLSDVCPHLGCGVPWRDDEKIFHCPCHHAKFDPSGRLLGGPSPRSLDPLPIKVENGKLMVQYQIFRNLVKTREVIG
ncbi:MAG TPA: ubiquinol-cytochrome c reductase iron-sulfur subunit [Thermoanaerobaculia bacterium]|nr:ubiquinol-cytochrome c reductase iron-sulfur subunit [Thermoanaerobaculia bacterium]